MRGIVAGLLADLRISHHAHASEYVWSAGDTNVATDSLLDRELAVVESH